MKNTDSLCVLHTERLFNLYTASILPEGQTLSSGSVSSAHPSSATATSLTLVPVGPVMISPSTAFSA